MPAFNFICYACNNKRRMLRATGPSVAICVGCGLDMVRDTVAPTSRSTEVLDSGAMTRPLERLDNAEEIFRDRAHTDPRENE